jgi:hypothetical protein
VRTVSSVVGLPGWVAPRVVQARVEASRLTAGAETAARQIPIASRSRSTIRS